MTTPPAVHAACLCGAVRLRIGLPSKWVAHCHCTCCRRAHGAPFVTWAGFASEQFTLEPDSAPPRWYESSPGARRAFCPNCGSPMLFESTRWPGETHVSRALIAGALDREPAAHVFYETHVSWLEVRDELPKKSSPGSAADGAQQARDWAACPAVEREPAGGAWVFRGTQVPIAALFEYLEDGEALTDFLEWFPDIPVEQVRAVLEHAGWNEQAAP